MTISGAGFPTYQDAPAMIAQFQAKIAALRQAAAKLPRFALTQLPTPLHACPRFSAALGKGVNVVLKRDDLIHTGFGGNKIRKLEFSIGKMKADGYDVLIHGLAGQSNYCRQTAAAAAVAGIPCHLILRKDHKAEDPAQANRLLDYVFGAHVTMVDNHDQQAAAKDALVKRLIAEGRKPYLVGSDDEAFGGVAYALCLAEILEQSAALGFIPDAICVTGGDGTSAGLLLGKRLLGYHGQLLGFIPAPTKSDEARCAKIIEYATAASQLLGSKQSFELTELQHTSAYGGPQYGEPSPGCLEALSLLGRTEGVVLGPVYTAKGMAGLIDGIRSGKIAGKNVVFLHTGGTPEIFAYNHEVMGYLQRG